MNVITFARSPVIPKATKTSAGRGSSTRLGLGVAEATVVVIVVSSLAWKRLLRGKRYAGRRSQRIVPIA
jgi:ABC-type anion transport system duplicated permease subunit